MTSAWQTFADLDAEAARIASQLEKFQTADDLLPAQSDRSRGPPPAPAGGFGEAEMALQAARERYESGQEQLAASTREFDEERFQEAVAEVDGDPQQQCTVGE